MNVNNPDELKIFIAVQLGVDSMPAPGSAHGIDSAKMFDRCCDRAEMMVKVMQEKGWFK